MHIGRIDRAKPFRTYDLDGFLMRQALGWEKGASSTMRPIVTPWETILDRNKCMVLSILFATDIRNADSANKQYKGLF